MRKSTIAGTWLAAVALATGLAWAAPSAGAETPDPWITAKVKTSLLTARDVDGTDIQVDTTDGRVTLQGTASSAAEKARAEGLAKEVSGVREVRNLIQVVPESARQRVSATDEQIEKQVSDALGKEPALSGVTVQSVHRGVVVLGGKVDALSAHLRALEVTRGVPGVQRVESDIRSPDRLADEEIWHDPGTGSTQAGIRSAANDLWITSASKVRLLASDVPAMDINVDTRDGVVTLFGSVASDAQKRTAEQEVNKVEGVKSVRNEIQVVPEAQREATQRRDADIQRDVEKRVEQHLGHSDIDVEVANGVVHLTGTVPSQGDRLAALTAARSGEGVRSVVGDLRVERD